jgi:hypothetical protein
LTAEGKVAFSISLMHLLTNTLLDGL